MAKTTVDELDDILAQKEAQLIANRDAALKAYERKPTGVNLKVFKKARLDLEDFLKAKAEPTAADQVFDTIMDVVEFLDGKGWKISKTSAYDHWKKEGKIKARSAGGFSLTSVMDYARDHLQKKDGSSGDEDSSDLGRRKQTAEIRRISSDADLRELKLRRELGELIPKSQVEIELADRASSLKTYLDAVARSSAGRIIKLVQGDPQKAAELINFLLGVNRKAMDNYSRPIEGLEEEEE